MTLSANYTQAINASSPIAQIIPGRLYYTSYEGTAPRNDAKTVYVDIDEQVHYDAFYDDFGPLNLAVLYRFCQSLNALLQTHRQNKRIFLYTNMCPQNRVNAVYLIASYMIIHQNLTAEQAYLRLQTAEPPAFVGFRDAALGAPSYLLHVQHVIQAIEKAVKFKWLDFDTFDPEEYEHFERVENGDLNWIVPGKVLSFCGPHDRSYVENGYPYHAPEVYFDYFRTNNVTAIIRLNKKIYEAKRFTEAGFEHHDLFFIDGSTPNDDIVLRFIDVVDRAKGAVAVHCKAGLGRTGTLIACWMMKHFRLTAPQCMGWLRVCRPGSVIGPQQHFLIEKQAWCWRLGQEEKQKAQNAIKSMEEEAVKPVESKQYSQQNGKLPQQNDNREAAEEGAKAVWSAKQALETETAIDETGRSQGDRLCEIKASRQQRLRNRRLQLNVSSTSSSSGRQSPPAFMMPTLPSGSGKPQHLVPSATKYCSATTPIKQLKLMSTAGRNSSSRLATSSAGIYKPMAVELLRNLRSSPTAELVMNNSSRRGAAEHAAEMEREENGAAVRRRAQQQAKAGTKIPIQKVSVSTSSGASGGTSSSSYALLRGPGLHRKHFSHSRLLKPYLPAAPAHFANNNSNIAEQHMQQMLTSGPMERAGNAAGTGYKLDMKTGANANNATSSSSATTSFGRALNRQYERIAKSGALQPATSSAQIQHVSGGGDQQQHVQAAHQHVQGVHQHQAAHPHQAVHQPTQFSFNSPLDGPLAHQTSCKYELRPRSQLHLPSRFFSGAGDVHSNIGIGTGHNYNSSSNNNNSGSSSRMMSPTSMLTSSGAEHHQQQQHKGTSISPFPPPAPLSRHHRATRSSTALLSSRI